MSAELAKAWPLSGTWQAVHFDKRNFMGYWINPGVSFLTCVLVVCWVQSLVLTYLGMELRWFGWTDAMELRHRCYLDGPLSSLWVCSSLLCTDAAFKTHPVCTFFDTFLTCDLIFLSFHKLQRALFFVDTHQHKSLRPSRVFEELEDRSGLRCILGRSLRP